MHMRNTILALLALALPAQAFTLDELRKSLSEYRGDSAMRVKIDATHRRGEGKSVKQSSGSSIAEDDGASVRLVHDKKELRKQLAKKDSDRTDHDVSAAEAMELMNFAPSLIRMIEGATLKRAVPTTFEGAAATLVEFMPVREKDEDGDKYIKSYVDVVTLWLGPGNVPIAAERTMKIKARILVISAEFEKKEKFRFARNGDRLIVTAHSMDSTSSGLGRSEKEAKRETVVKVGG